jgi:hypothetical protein
MDSGRGGVFHHGGEDRKLNVIQLVLLSWILGLTAVTAARFAGFGWGVSILIGWAGMVLGTLGITALLLLLDGLLQRPTAAQDGQGADQVDALIDAWDKDLLLDRARARAEMTDLSRGYITRREPSGG